MQKEIESINDASLRSTRLCAIATIAAKFYADCGGLRGHEECIKAAALCVATAEELLDSSGYHEIQQVARNLAKVQTPPDCTGER